MKILAEQQAESSQLARLLSSRLGPRTSSSSIHVESSIPCVASATPMWRRHGTRRSPTCRPDECTDRSGRTGLGRSLLRESDWFLGVECPVHEAWLDAVGTQNRYAVGSVDQNAMHVVADAMYGSIVMAPVSDVDNCDYFVLVGANPAVSAWNWLETVPGGWKRTLERQRRGATIVVVDPLRTETADKADIHLAVRPGQDWALLLAMVKVILEEGLEHKQDCTELATGVPELRKLVADADLDDLASRCDVPREQIERVAREFANARRAMVVTRTGVSLHPAGTIGEWLGHVLNVITGRMDRPGGRGIEPGYVDVLKLSGLAKAPTHTSRLQGRGLVAGAHSLSELPDEITIPGRGRSARW